ncbi:hypothetical protein GCM10027451_48740 [Geodermatophilus aquaeductus]
MPRATGTSTIAKTCTVLPNCRPIDPASGGSKTVTARLVTSGSVTTASSELTAVRETLSATSPRKRWLNRFAVVPPGEAASSSMPTASTGSRPTAITSPKQSAGSTSSCSPRATTAARGRRVTRTKSSTVSDSPSPNMTTARAAGRATVARAESTGDLRNGRGAGAAGCRDPGGPGAGRRGPARERANARGRSRG